jgi:hypothetical protein
VTVSYLTDGGGDSAWTDADDVTGDAVLEQFEPTYDANNNVILVTARQRFHDETGTGALGNPSTAPKARVSYAAMYYDLADRPTATVNVGTNGGSSYTRPSSVPSRSDAVLVTSQTYNSAGWVDKVSDPRGIEDRLYYNNLGWTTKTIEAYVDGTPDATTDRTTEFTYNGNGQTKTLKVHLTGGAYQETEWIYGVTTTGSSLNSNDIVAEMRYPDKSTGGADAEGVVISSEYRSPPSSLPWRSGTRPFACRSGFPASRCRSTSGSSESAACVLELRRTRTRPCPRRRGPRL